MDNKKSSRFGGSRSPRKGHPTNQPKKPAKETRIKPLYIFSVLILVIVVVAFVGGPVSGRHLGGNLGQIVFGRYRGRDVAYSPGNYFARSYGALAAQVSHQQSDNVELQLRILWREAFDRALLHTAILVDSEQSGMDVSETRIDQAIAESPQFQRDGRFSPELYRQVSNQERLTLRDFYAEGLLHERYLEDRADGARVGPAELEFVRSLGLRERQIRFSSFNFGDFPEEQIAAYVGENPNRFQRLDLSVISTEGSQFEAEEIRTRIVERTANFEDLARELSQDIFADSGGEMGATYLYRLEPDYDDPSQVERLLELQVDEISQPFETINGWAIYRLNAAPIAPDLTNPETLETIRSYMNSFERGRIEDYLSAQATELRQQSLTDGLEAGALAAGRQTSVSEFFPINYGQLEIYPTVDSLDSDDLAGVSFPRSFFIELFQLQEGEISEPFVLGDRVFLFELVAERQTDPEDYDFLDSYYPTLVNQFQTAEIERELLAREYVFDNFNETFVRYVIGANATQANQHQ